MSELLRNGNPSFRLLASSGTIPEQFKVPNPQIFQPKTVLSVKRLQQFLRFQAK